MNRICTFLVALALVVLIASPVLAVNVVGTVKTVNSDQNQFVLTDQNGRDWTIHCNQNTQIQTNNNNQARLSDLRQGQAVNVNYELQNNQMVATGINAQQAQQAGQQGQQAAQAQQGQQQQQAQQQQGQQAAQREERGQRQGQHTARGKIEKVNADQHQFTLKDQNSRELTFQCGRDARVEVNGKEAKLGDLQQGQEITVTYRQVLTDIRAGERAGQTGNAQQERGQMVQGQIQQVEAAQNQIRLRDQNGKDHTFQISRDTQVQVNGRNATLADLQQGQQVTATRQMVANDIRTGEQNR